MFEEQIRAFNENISTLRLFVEEIGPVLINKREESSKDILPLFLAGIRNGLPKEKVQKLSKDDNIDEKIDKLLIDKFGEKLNVTFDEIDMKNILESGKICMPNFKVSGSKEGVAKVSKAIHKYDDQLNLLYCSSLISLLSSTEWFFSQILHQYYSRHPKAAGIENKTMTLNDLKSFLTIKDAIDYLIDNKIEGILRSSFEDWLQVLENEMKLGLGYLKSVKNELQEIYQRRNIIIHNGSIVNSIFLAKVDKTLINGIKIGDKLQINEEYLEKAICIFHKTFILIAAELWKSLEPENSKRADSLIDIIYENLITKNWTVSEGLSYFLSKDTKMAPLDRCIGQLNYWLSKKRMGQWDEIKDEVTKADYSDKKNILRLGLMGLLEDVDGFLTLLPIALNSKETTPDKVMEFPIFEEIRLTDKFKQFLRDSKEFGEFKTSVAEC